MPKTDIINRFNIKKRVVRKILMIPRLGPILSYKFTNEGIRLQQMLIHKNIKGYPEIKGEIQKDIVPTEQDLLLTKRLLKAYKKALERKNNITNKDVWSFLAKGPHAEFVDLLEKENISDIAFYLCNMSRMEIGFGFMQGKNDYNKLLSDPTYRRWLDLFNLDKVITLAEALGVIPIEDPEQGEYGSSIFLNTNEIIKKIERYLKIQLSPPNIEGGQYKLSTNKGKINNKDLNSVYTSWRCKEIIKTIKNPSICEIGAGLGKSAYYSYLFGINRYTIIDLPYINILQGFYLIKSLPSANIYLYGETKARNKKNSIFILPDWSLEDMDGKLFDLTLNQDSFPEIDKKTVLKYLDRTNLLTRHFLLSINQESQNTMGGDQTQNITFRLISDRKDFELIYRFPYWMRLGYVEELYKIK